MEAAGGRGQGFAEKRRHGIGEQLNWQPKLTAVGLQGSVLSEEEEGSRSCALRKSMRRP